MNTISMKKKQTTTIYNNLNESKKKIVQKTRHKKGTHYLTSFTRNSRKDKTLETKQINSFRGINEKMQERTLYA